MEEILTVRGAPAGFGCDRTHASDPAPVHFYGANIERLQRARHGGLGKAAAAGQALTQADDARKSVNDPKSAIGGRSRDQKTAVIGAQIDCGINPAQVGLARIHLHTPVHAGPAGS